MSQSPRQFDALLAAMIDQTITPAERDALMQMLRDDAELRRQYIEHLLLDADMHWDHARVQTVPAMQTPSPISGSGAWYSALRDPKATLPLAAAALIALAATVWFLLPAPTPTHRPDVPAVAPSIAMLTAAEDAVFAGDQEPVQPGSELSRGVMKLTAGSAQVMFNSGAVVDLTGPCAFEMTDSNSGRLLSGQLEAYVPPQAKHFVVETVDGLRVTDLGTRFTVYAGEDLDRVSVLEGVVVAEFGAQRAMLTAPMTACVMAGRLLVTDTRSVRIDLGRRGQETGIVAAQTWNNFSPNTGSAAGIVEAHDAEPDLPALRYVDGAASGIDFDLSDTPGSAAARLNQGVGSADWPEDFSQAFGYPVSATRDMFYMRQPIAFTFSNLRTDGTLYDLTIFGAIQIDRPNTVIQVNGVEKHYDPNTPGQVVFTNLRPDAEGRLRLTARREGDDGYGHISVITLTELVPEHAAADIAPVPRQPEGD